MKKCFNIAGPCNKDEHYMLPPLQLIPEMMPLVQERQYFVLHAPRQSGKTTALLALCDALNKQGECHAVYCTLEAAGVGSDKTNVIMDVTNQIWLSTRGLLQKNGLPEIKPDASLPKMALQLYLSDICGCLDKPLVLLLDEVDVLEGDTLLSLLRQLRAGYVSRAQSPFPSSIALVGMRNIRDYKIKIRPESVSLGSGSPFNIVTKYLTLGMFTKENIRQLYEQHTHETGQFFADVTIDRVHYWTDGQPWLVNAIARECVENFCKGDCSKSITPDMVDKAAYAIILRRDVHIDSLLARLREPEIRNVLQPVILGGNRLATPDFDDNLSYVLDLGLLKYDEAKRLVPANRMYAEVFLRTLSMGYQEIVKEKYPSPTVWNS